jgi:hypothetical protein
MIKDGLKAGAGFASEQSGSLLDLREYSLTGEELLQVAWPVQPEESA